MRSRSSTHSGGDPEPSLGQLLRQLSTEIATLVRQEIALAKSEVAASLRRVGSGAGLVVAGLVLAGLGGLVLTAFLVVLAADLLDNAWLGALLVAVLYLAAGALGARASLGRMRRVSLTPEETLRTLRDTGEWARGEVAQLGGALKGGEPTPDVALPLARPATALAPAPAAPLPPAPPRAPLPTATVTADHGSGAAAVARREEKAPRRGVGALLRATWREFGEDDVLGQAAKLAYYTFLALPPALMAVFALTGIFGGERTADWISGELSGALPADAYSVVSRFIEEVVTQQAPGPLSIGLLLAVWSASSIFTGMSDSLNVAYDVTESRSWVRRRLTALGVTLAFLVLLLGSAVVLIAGPALARAVGLGGLGTLVWTVAQWPLSFAFVVAAFWIAYYVLPDKDQSGCRVTLLKASAASALLWLLATAAFRLYVANFSSYTESYGFLGGFIVLLLWMYLTGIVILAGGELASEMEKS